MKLISWNVAGRSNRVVEQVEALALREPHIVALQEVAVRTAVTLRASLLASGFSHIVDSFALAADPALLTGPRHYGQIIASRFPFSVSSPDEFDVPWTERILSAYIEAPCGVIEVHTTHIPPGSSNFWIKIEMLEGLYKGLAHHSANPRILCGDFNTPQQERVDGEVVTWGQRINSRGAAVLRKRIRTGTGERWDAAERKVLLGLTEYDLQDVYRSLTGYLTSDHSWHLKRGDRSISRRYDHILASAALRPVSCGYWHSFRESGLSDHSPIEAVFQPASI